MKNVFRLIWTGLILLGLGLFPLAAQDFGFVLDNATGLSGSFNPAAGSLLASQKDKITAWFDAHFNEQLQFFFQGNYTFALDQYVQFDLDYLYIKGGIPFNDESQGLFTWQAGRFDFEEFSHLVLSHQADGISLSFDLPAMTFSLATGFTGLVLRPVSRIILSQNDFSSINRGDIFLAAPRLIEMIRFDFVELIGRQDVSIAILAQQDLRNSDELAKEGDTTLEQGKGGKLHSEYLGAGISGPLASPLYWDFFCYLGTGNTLSYVDDGTPAYENKFMLSALGGLGLQLFLQEQLNQSIDFNFLFATGDSDYVTEFYEGNTRELAHTFIPISKQDLGLIFSPVLGNLMLFELSYSLKPFSQTGNPYWEDFQTLFKGIAFFRTSQGLISETGLNPGSDDVYLGTEVDVVINWRPFSDFGLALSWGFFFPNNAAGTGAFDPNARSIETKGLLELSMAF